MRILIILWTALALSAQDGPKPIEHETYGNRRSADQECTRQKHDMGSQQMSDQEHHELREALERFIREHPNGEVVDVRKQ